MFPTYPFIPKKSKFIEIAICRNILVSFMSNKTKAHEFGRTHSMFNFKSFKSTTSLLLLMGMTTGSLMPIVAPILAPAPAVAQSAGFSDVASSYWAKDFIEALASRDIIKGFPDGTFRPQDPVTRAQFAAMLRQAFNKNKSRDAVRFTDVSSSYWAYTAIQEAYQTEFLSGYPGNIFRPEQRIPREQVLVSLANGLGYSATNAVASDLQFYNDASAISSYARNSIAAATEKKIVVNYSNVKQLNPGRNATRAEVAAFIYQALVSAGDAAAISSPYIVALVDDTPQNTAVTIPAGTAIPVRYEKQKILVTPDEKAPLTLTVAANIQTNQGTVVIPAGSEVVGELQPATGGSQFVARELRLPNGQRLPISASSQAITKTEQITKGTSVRTVIKDTVLGAAAAAAVSAVTGDRAIATEEVLGGAGIGTLIGLFLGRDKVNLIVVEPNTALSLKLNQDLTVQP